MNRTNIEYLTHTWNVTHGCSPVSKGCQNCWAKVMSKRLAGMGVRGYNKDNPFKPTICPWKLNEPLKIKKPARVGVSFMGDLFHEEIEDWMLDSVFDRICYDGIFHHTFIVLTKRPERMKEYCSRDYAQLFLPYMSNVWLGVSVENQKRADERIPVLLRIPAMVRFVSLEPLLEWTNISYYLRNSINWVIMGAESGPGARPMKYDWAFEVAEQCRYAGVPLFYKQGPDDEGNWCKMPKLQGIVWDKLPTFERKND